MLIKVEGCTLCGSDIHSIGGRRSVPVPTVPGHEIVGHVLDWGADFAPSDVTGRSLKI
ncbi:MAG: alcohol dehydrogenase catalytic domain-containing protein [Planctomycetaceae bacterium]|nr:alcohol dehydrogenase catalytic domain-containing protein [Planctomycetaceae bacterium]